MKILAGRLSALEQSQPARQEFRSKAERDALVADSMTDRASMGRLLLSTSDEQKRAAIAAAMRADT